MLTFAQLSQIGLPLCVALSVLGSASYVFSIMAIAYPAFLVERGREPFSPAINMAFIGLYGLGQGGALVLPLVATWFGPVSIQLPIYQASMLITNMVVMSALKMETFAKNQRVGTEVIVVATVMLMDAGPDVPDDDAEVAPPSLASPLALLWISFVGVLWVGSMVGMTRDVLGRQHSARTLMAVYVVAQGVGTSATTTLGKLLSLTRGPAMVVVMVYHSAHTQCHCTSWHCTSVHSSDARGCIALCGAGALHPCGADQHMLVRPRGEEAQPGGLHPVR